nr:immunoglobulin heavy chain junction region [Mus musculus]
CARSAYGSRNFDYW